MAQGSPPPDPRTLLQSDFPDDLLLALCRQVVEGYSSAWLFCDENYPREQRHDLYPVMRRADIERNVRHILERFPSSSATVEPNRIGAAYHVLVHSGRVALTISAVNSRRQMVRAARFREQYAIHSLQDEMFPTLNRQNEEGGATLYAILVHGETEKHPQLPAFMDVVFPSPDYNSYYDRIDLFARFPQVNEWLRPVAEKIMTPTPSLKKIKAPKESAE